MMRSSIKIVLILSLLMLIACVYPEKCRESDAVHLEKTPFLGIGYRVVSGFDKLPGVETNHGLRVAQVVSGSAAEKAGIKVNDIIIAYDSVKLKDREESKLLQSFGNYIKKEKAVGENISLTVIRTETAFEGKRDKEGLSIKNRDDIEDLLDDQKLGETLEFSVKREAHLIEIVATLGEKGNPALEKPPENRLLFPEYETLSCPYSDLGNQLIDEFDIGDVYLDLLKRYEDDEMESDTFRLNLFRYVHRDPLRFPLVAEKISGDLDDCGKKVDLPEIIRYGSNLLDESSEDGQAIIGIPSSREPEAHLSFIRNVVLSALTMRNRAFETLEEEDKEFLFENLPLLIENGFETDSTEAESEEEIQKNERALRLLGEADYGALLKSAEILAQLANAKWLSDFRGAMIDYHSPETHTIRGIGGDIIYAEDTGAGLIVIGGAGPNRYEMSPAVLIDLGGNDFYGDGDDSDFSENPLSVLIDCSGNDEYSATATFAQGAGILGTGILMDLAGDDTYHSTRFSQGTGVLGVGILADLEGDDRYFGQEFNQGVAFWGMGILIDSEGVDSYRSHLVAQGVGGPKGMGLLMDQSGDDSYYATGKEPSSYGTPGIFNGYSQG
ncbi:MAG: PDZ domain-containing protein, partial [Syntrophobacterales bacterium]